MKRLLSIWVTILMSCAFASAQVQEQVESLQKQGNEQFSAKNYKEAIKSYEQGVAMLSTETTKNDSLLAQMLNMVARCHYRLTEYGKAAEYTVRSLEHFRVSQDTTSLEYGMRVDNLALNYAGLRKFDEARYWSKRAVDIYFKELPNNYDMMAVLLHAAEINDAAGASAEAAILQENVLVVAESVVGKMSDTYLNELKFLVKYYRNADNEEKAEEAESRIAELEEMRDHGYVPALVKFDTVEKCHEHTIDVFYCGRYLRSHYPDAEGWAQSAQYMNGWSMATDQVQISFGEAEAEWMSNEKAVFLLPIYFAGVSMYCIENNINGVGSFEAYAAGVLAVLNYYQSIKENIGEIEALEKYLKLYEKGEDRLEKKIRKDFGEYNKAAAKGETTTLIPVDPDEVLKKKE